MVNETFAEFYEKHFEGVKRYFLRQFGKGFAENEDLAQETFYRLFKHTKAYGDVDTNRFYLYKIAERVKYDYIRRRAGLAVVNIDDLQLPAYCDVTLAGEVNFAVSSLSDADKVLIELLSQKLKSHEIAVVLNITPSAVRARIKKLRTKLKGMME